jgi:DTW domain-containing protein YfiP
MSEPAEIAEPVAECPHCGKPMPLCICDSVTPIENRIAVLILQHPQEQDRTLGTAGLTARHFKDAVVKIGLSAGPYAIPRAGPCSISVRPR